MGWHTILCRSGCIYLCLDIRVVGPGQWLAAAAAVAAAGALLYKRRRLQEAPGDRAGRQAGREGGREARGGAAQGRAKSGCACARVCCLSLALG